MDEAQIKLWIHSRPECAAVDMKMQELCGISKQSSEQHKDHRASRVERDTNDVAKESFTLLQSKPLLLQ
jgi:hypothetical protein